MGNNNQTEVFNFFFTLHVEDIRNIDTKLNVLGYLLDTFYKSNAHLIKLLLFSIRKEISMLIIESKIIHDMAEEVILQQF